MSVCSAAARGSDGERRRGNYRPSRGSSIRISVMDPRVRVDVEAFFTVAFFLGTLCINGAIQTAT